MLELGPMWVEFPITVPAKITELLSIVQWLPMWTPSAIRTPGPIEQDSPRIDRSETVAVGSIADDLSGTKK